MKCPKCNQPVAVRKKKVVSKVEIMCEPSEVTSIKNVYHPAMPDCVKSLIKSISNYCHILRINDHYPVTCFHIENKIIACKSYYKEK